jgi:hypothetical protein
MRCWPGLRDRERRRCAPEKQLARGLCFVGAVWMVRADEASVRLDAACSVGAAAAQSQSPRVKEFSSPAKVKK